MDHAVALPGAAAAAAPAAAAAEAPWRSPASARVALAMTLLVLGCAAAELSLVCITLNPDSSRFMGACAPTDAEAAGLRAGSELLLLAAVAQVLAAAVALLVPARPCAFAATTLAALTAYRATAVLLMLATCHGHVHVHGAHALHLVLLLAAQVAALVVAVAVCIDHRLLCH